MDARPFHKPSFFAQALRELVINRVVLVTGGHEISCRQKSPRANAAGWHQESLLMASKGNICLQAGLTMSPRLVATTNKELP